MIVRVRVSLDPENYLRSGCRNVSHQQQSFSGLPSPGRFKVSSSIQEWLLRRANPFKTFLQCKQYDSKPAFSIVAMNWSFWLATLVDFTCCLSQQILYIEIQRRGKEIRYLKEDGKFSIFSHLPDYLIGATENAPAKWHKREPRFSASQHGSSTSLNAG